jgi:hypothetical protein
MEPAWNHGIRIQTSIQHDGDARTMLNQSRAGLESSRSVVINAAATTGRNPNVKFMILYFPVRWMNQLKVHGE